ncbi:MAG: hypothetical protein LBM94_04405 [Propionibacteriaceae bacterium]|jgi:hypothetical protein|nr:hypothetical protein [Propionibacteriaceae bacterium]
MVDAAGPLCVLNFSGHPVTPGVRAAIEDLVVNTVDIYELPRTVDTENLADECLAWFTSVPLDLAQWQEHPPLVMVPALGSAAVALVAVVQGVVGSFPRLLWLTKNPSTAAFDEPHILDLDELRLIARRLRY